MARGGRQKSQEVTKMTWECGINKTRRAEREEKTTTSGGGGRGREGKISKALGSWISQRLLYAE